MGREVRQLQVQRLLGVTRRDDALRLAGHEISHVLVVAFHRVIISRDPVQIVAALLLQSNLVKGLPLPWADQRSRQLATYASEIEIAI